MNVIIAAVVGGTLLLWGGVIGLLRVVDLFERKHMVLLGAYTTLVAACVMGLVLYTNFERHKESRRELQAQMEEFSGRLNELSEKLVNQLEEKADLTASEFEIRVKLQNETQNHQRTQHALQARIREYDALKQSLDTVLAASRQYRREAERQRQERFAKEEARYSGLQSSMVVHQRALQMSQRQLSALQEDLAALKTQTAGMQKTQTALLAKLNSTRELLENRLQALDKRVQEVATTQTASQQATDAIRTRVDSLYKWNTD